MQTTRSARLTRGAHTAFMITNPNRMRNLVVEERFRKVAAWHRPRISRCACVSPKCGMTAEAGSRNVDRMRQPCCMKDGGRPSGCGLQDLLRAVPRVDSLLRGENTRKFATLGPKGRKSICPSDGIKGIYCVLYTVQKSNRTEIFTTVSQNMNSLISPVGTGYFY